MIYQPIITLFFLIMLMVKNMWIYENLGPYLFKFSIIPGIAIGQWYRHIYYIYSIENKILQPLVGMFFSLIAFSFAMLTLIIYSYLIRKAIASFRINDYGDGTLTAIGTVIILVLHIYIAAHAELFPGANGVIRSFI